MSFINRLSNRLSKAMVDAGIIDNQKLDIYVYCFNFILEQFFYAVSILLLGAFCNRFIISLLCLFMFSLLRSFAGGIHAPTRQLCVLCSYGVFFLVFILAPIVSPVHSFLWFILFFNELLVISMLSPIDTPNKRFTIEQKKKLQKYCQLACLASILLFSILFYFQYTIYYGTLTICGMIILIGQLLGILQNRIYQGRKQV